MFSWVALKVGVLCQTKMPESERLSRADSKSDLLICNTNVALSLGGIRGTQRSKRSLISTGLSIISKEASSLNPFEQSITELCTTHFVNTETVNKSLASSNMK